MFFLGPTLLSRAYFLPLVSRSHARFIQSSLLSWIGSSSSGVVSGL